MLIKIVSSSLLVLVGLTIGLGISYWEKVEIVNIVFYSGLLMVALSGLIFFGFELWQYVHNYRQSVLRQWEHFGKAVFIPGQTKMMPSPEKLHPSVQSLDTVEALFNHTDSQTVVGKG